MPHLTDSIPLLCCLPGGVDMFSIPVVEITSIVVLGIRSTVVVRWTAG